MVAGNSRQHWLIQLEWHGARVSGSIMANGRTLLPKLPPGPPSEAVRYVQWALVDMRDGDLVEISVQPDSALRAASYRVASPGVALSWLEETLGARSRDSEEDLQTGPLTATLPKLAEPPEHGAAAPAPTGRR